VLPRGHGQRLERGQETASRGAGTPFVSRTSIKNDHVARARAFEQVPHPDWLRLRSVAEMLMHQPLEIREPSLRNAANCFTDLEHRRIGHLLSSVGWGLTDSESDAEAFHRPERRIVFARRKGDRLHGQRPGNTRQDCGVTTRWQQQAAASGRHQVRSRNPRARSPARDRLSAWSMRCGRAASSFTRLLVPDFGAHRESLRRPVAQAHPRSPTLNNRPTEALPFV
jgi:hypothetical protein